VVLAFLVYLIAGPRTRPVPVLAFFCQLPLSKSQADALWRQLAQHGEKDVSVRLPQDDDTLDQILPP